jgi:hypothetical protein
MTVWGIRYLLNELFIFFVHQGLAGLAGLDI